MPDSGYRGRFAPSPTGPLHFGSLVAALASYLDARAQGGEWLLRIDDIDRGRCVAGMDAHIVRTLEDFGFEWNGEITYQSDNTEAYRSALATLQRQGRIYYCRCSRKQIAAAATRAGLEGPIYPGTCRTLGLRDGTGRAARVRTGTDEIHFEDRLFGAQRQCLERDIGDFVVRRADGYFAYQLAVVVDDCLAGINQVVRGADLLLSTPRQIWLGGLLGFPSPGYLHIPLVLDADGKKLSKTDRAHPVNPDDPLPALLQAWRFLRQPLPEPDSLSLQDFWLWARERWRPEHLKEAIRHE